jgi:5-methylcytosine-specific restriction protein A
MPNAPKQHRPRRSTGKRDARPSASRRGYDEDWKKVRAAHLAAHPLCPCGRPAKHVDHKVALEAGGTSEEGNLQSYCHSCHSRKTCALDGGFGRPKHRG